MIDKLLTTCDKEPIHYLSRIQQHGCLFVVSYDTFTILQLSDNTLHLIHCDPSLALNKPLEDFFENSFIARLNFFSETLKAEKKRFGTFYEDNFFQKLFCVLHCEEHFLILEITPLSKEKDTSALSTEQMVLKAIACDAPKLPLLQLLDSMALAVHEISGFDRVLLYKFDEDYNGTVLAQIQNVFDDNFLGHHFPSSDIPVQARALYLKNRFRIIENVDEESAIVYPALNPMTHAPLDMTFCYGRSVSPIHLHYLQNMGVSSSMSLSLIVEGRLWGLIVCHHSSPKSIPYTLYETYSLLSTVFSSQIEQKEHLLHYEKSFELRLKRELFLNSLHAVQDMTFFDALTQEIKNLATVISCDVAVVCHEGKFIASIPLIEDFSLLLSLVKNNLKEGYYQSSRLGHECPEFNISSIPLGGLIACEIPNLRDTYLMFIRLEQIETIQWAGEPVKHVTIENTIPIINPRASFQSWKETVTGTSQPFCLEEIESILQLAKDFYTLHKQFNLYDEARKLKKLHHKLFELLE